MVADLDRDHFARLNCFQLGRKMLGALLNFRKCARSFSLCVEDGGALAMFFARLFPRLENRVA